MRGGYREDMDYDPDCMSHIYADSEEKECEICGGIMKRVKEDMRGPTFICQDCGCYEEL